MFLGLCIFAAIVISVILNFLGLGSDPSKDLDEDDR